MRISMLNMYSTNLSSMQSSLSELGELNQEMATSKRILKPSDDPLGELLVLNAKNHKTRVDQYVKNISGLSTSLGQTETYLRSFVNLQNRMKEIAISTNNSDLSPQDKKAYGSELKELLKEAVDLFNSKDDTGNYIFSGQDVKTPPISNNGGTYQVDQNVGGERMIQTSESSWMVSNTTIDQLNAKEFLNKTQEYIQALDGKTKDFEKSTKEMQKTLDDTLNSITGAVTDIGGKQNSLELMKSAHKDMMLFSDKTIKETEALDYPKAASDFQMRLTALKVSQKTFVQISHLNLFSEM